MSEPFLAEVRIMSFNFPPKGWALCNGQFLPINQNQALFSLLGTTFGGNGQTTFALPNMQGRTPNHMGGGFTLGESGGQISHTLITSEMPQHVHLANGSSSTGNQVAPTNNLLASPLNQTYRPPSSNLTTLAPSSVSTVGGSQPHENRQPYLTLSFCIALQGIFPSQN